MNFNLSGKTAVITGAAGLLGREHALALSSAGANLVCIDIETQKLEELRSALTADVEYLFLECDIADENAVQSAWKQITQQFSGPFVLVNNAAIDPKVSKDNSDTNSSRLENFPLDKWNQEVAVGLTGAMLWCKYLGQTMSEQGDGVIINIASDLGVIAPDQRLYKTKGIPEDQQNVKPVTYSVIKHGLIGMTKYLATYWADKGVRCNALAPAGVQTNQNKEFVQKLTSLIPMGRMAARDEYHGALVFMASDASKYLNGQTIVMDGGRSIW